MARSVKTHAPKPAAPKRVPPPLPPKKVAPAPKKVHRPVQHKPAHKQPQQSKYYHNEEESDFSGWPNRAQRPTPKAKPVHHHWRSRQAGNRMLDEFGGYSEQARKRREEHARNWSNK